MGTLQTSLTWFFSALRTSPELLKKMKIVILLFAVLATINAAALQNAKAADKPAAVKAADLPKPAKVEDRLEAEEDMAETQEDEGEDDNGETQEDEGEDPFLGWIKCLFKPSSCHHHKHGNPKQRSLG